jgi:hypothetical protein
MQSVLCLSIYTSLSADSPSEPQVGLHVPVTPADITSLELSFFNNLFGD